MMNSQNIISFDIYLLLIVCFLCIACYFISNDLIISLSNNLQLFQFRNIDKSEVSDLLDMFVLAKIYILRKQWLSCILMLEYSLCHYELQENVIEYNNCLAFCFCKLGIYDRAEKYYLMSLDNYPEDMNTLYCLANVYILSNRPRKAKEIYQNILRTNPNDKKVKKSLDMLVI